MEKITNKEVIVKLTEYFKSQDHDAVSLFAAGAIADLLRFLTIDALEDGEALNLIQRTQKNINQMWIFLQTGVIEPLVVYRESSDKEVSK